MITEEIKKINEKIRERSELEAVMLKDTGWIEAILEICYSHGFTEQDSLEAVRELGYVLLGVSEPQQAFDEIKLRTNLADASVKLLFKDFYEQICKPTLADYQEFKSELEFHRTRLEQELKQEEAKRHLLVVPVKEALSENKEVQFKTESLQTAEARVQQSVSDPYREQV